MVLVRLLNHCFEVATNTVVRSIFIRDIHSPRPSGRSLPFVRPSMASIPVDAPSTALHVVDLRHHAWCIPRMASRVGCQLRRRHTTRVLCETVYDTCAFVVDWKRMQTRHSARRPKHVIHMRLRWCKLHTSLPPLATTTATPKQPQFEECTVFGKHIWLLFTRCLR